MFLYSSYANRSRPNRDGRPSPGWGGDRAPDAEAADASLSIGLLAELCCISSGHLMRAFKQTTGETVHSYVERVRLTKAQRLLCETNLPLKAIAAELGFSTPSSFSFAFRRATGEPPKVFRQQFRKPRVH